jgi:MFS superfamily sulfate permease-like transporter
MLAGIAIAVALAAVMHVIQQASPNGGAPPCQGVGCPGYSIRNSVLLVLFLGLIIGLGLGIGLAAAVPERTVDSAAPHRATPTDQPPVPSA